MAAGGPRDQGREGVYLSEEPEVGKPGPSVPHSGASKQSELIQAWRQVVIILMNMPGRNDPASQPEAFSLLRRNHADMPLSVFSELQQMAQSLDVPSALRPFLVPSGSASPEQPGNIVGKPKSDLERQLGEAINHLKPAMANEQRFAPDTDAKTERILTPSSILDQLSSKSKAANGLSPKRRDVSISIFHKEQRIAAKAAFTLRRVPADAMRTLISGAIRPTTGDVVLARVDRVRHQRRIELISGRKAGLVNGDLILVAYGDRYATDQFEAHVPMNLNPTNLVATGGVAAQMLSKSSGLRSATEITPLGLVGNERGVPINLLDYGLKPVTSVVQRPKVIAVLGTSMNSGKTTTNRYLLTGLHRAGLKPGATKITGTGSGGDYWVMVDAGAHCMLDFTDIGYASTFRLPTPKLERAAFELVDHLTVAGCGVILVEIADGLLHEQNRELIKTEFFKNHVDGVLFAAGESLGASFGVALLRELDIPVIGISGKLTASQLMIEETRKSCDVPVYTREDLCDPVKALDIVGLTNPELPNGGQPENSPDRFSTSPLAGTDAGDIRP